MTYHVKEVFSTIQGEGYHSGTPAMFIRLAGCNLWSGIEKTRARDAQRNGAQCPHWCDTDFVGGTPVKTSQDLDALLYDAAPKPWPRLVVLTGGEPLLQADAAFINWLRARFRTVAIETNGTVEPKFDSTLAWISCSPKVAPERLKLHSADEIKVVYPSYSPLQYAYLSDNCFVQPVDPPLWMEVEDPARACAGFVMNNPGWRVSLQTHKILGVP